MKIIPNSLPDNDSRFVGISAMSITYTQAEDTCGRIGEDVQFLTIEAVPMDEANDYKEGSRPEAYYTLKTDRWAVDDPNEVGVILNDFINRHKMVTDTLKKKKGGE